MPTYFRESFNKFDLEYDIENKVLKIIDKYTYDNNVTIKFNNNDTIIDLKDILNKIIGLEKIMKG